LLATVGGLASSLFNYIDRHVLRVNGDASSFAWWFEFLRLVIFIFILPFDHFFIISFKSILIMLSLGVTEFISVYTFMKMHVFSELSVSSLISRLKLVWIPIIAFFLIGEELKILNYFGIFIVFLGLSFIVAPKKIRGDSGMKFALISSVMTGLLAVIVKMASSVASTSIIAIAMAVPFILIFPLLGKNSGERIKLFFKKDYKGIIIATVANAIAMYFLIAALRIGSASLVMGVYQGMVFTSVLAGIFILGETTDMWKKIIGSLVVLIGIIFLL